MIVVEINGRLGNQMFQYAFARSLALRWKTGFHLASKAEPFLLDQYFNLTFAFRVKRLFEKILKRKFERYERVDLFDHDECYEFLQRLEAGEEKKRNLYIRGFFQSEDYFKPHEQTIRRELRVRNRYLREFGKRYDVALHVRRGDYAIFGHTENGGRNACLPFSYYEKARQEIGPTDGTIAVVTESSDEIRLHEFDRFGNTVVEHNSLVEDFVILANSRILVISNSTFAWWAAYLGKAELVLAPRYWLGFNVYKETPKGIHCRSFVWVDAGDSLPLE